MASIKSKVMTIANRLVGKGYRRSTAMLKAWILAKAENLSTRVVGTSFNNRQNVLQYISGKPAAIVLRHEQDNPHDRSAVSVWVFADGTRGYYRIGYLPKAVAYVVAPLLDKGEKLKLERIQVTGGFNQYTNYGARLNLAI